jgi:hypothetical protein
MAQSQNRPDGQSDVNGTACPAAASVYFSPRSAPYPAADAQQVSTDTVAGVGAAWTWRGAPGEQLSAAPLASMQRFLVDRESAVKVLGGARFDPQTGVASEWEPFGSYYMLIPALELVRCTRHWQIWMLKSAPVMQRTYSCYWQVLLQDDVLNSACRCHAC